MVDHSKRSSSGRKSPRSGGFAAKKMPPAGQVRIIGGRWRGRKLPVVQADGLRPTGNRVRETLFNWLQMHVPGSRCLDLYAGSGALGLEAASRGAASVTLVESASIAASSLRQTLNEIGVDDKVSVSAMGAEQFLATQPAPFDIVFLDPPFDLHIHKAITDRLLSDFLNPGALLYMELPTKEVEIAQGLPSSLTLVKEKRFGDVTVFLLRNDA